MIKGTSRKLIIRNAAFDDEGRYCCEMGKAKTTCNLKVVEAEFAVVKKMVNVNCPLDGDAYFETVLSGPSAEPVWKMDGRQLSPSNDIEMEELAVDNGVLYRCILKNQQMDDSGKMSFTAMGNQCKQTAELIVKDLPLGFTKEIEDKTGEEYGSVEFEAHITRKNCVTVWMANNKPVRASDKYQITAKGFVRRCTITNLALTDNFNITCKITDGDESAETKASLKTGNFYYFDYEILFLTKKFLSAKSKELILT